MVFEDAGPRPARGAAVRDLTREDLDLYSVEDLDERIEALKAEIVRSEAARASKQARKSDADALFSFKS
ncbi:MAG: uncharacterized small protein (DUF1192 family) [Brevundimonas sp.]|jgi:uncharacterized small protein (DUF1192 family)|uniref:DUF1192 domain-containing protein n=1 Tax=Brevundimonas sp. TaxID=1871086 RepID=UPI0039E5780F